MTAPSPKLRRASHAALLRWFRNHARRFPWRPRAGALARPRAPYPTWVSEIMLQQTRTETAVAYFKEFLRRFPTVRALARASQEDVLKAWEGLGYYGRARNLHRAAGLVSGRLGGRLPRTADALRQLPGIGAYTAAAIASLCFGERVLAVDGNVRRVASRFFALRGTATDLAVRARLAPLMPDDAPGLFNEALMELGAVICTPRSPGCRACPLRTRCRAVELGRVHEFPTRRPRRAPPVRRVDLLVFAHAGRVFLQKRPSDGMLGGLWGFPVAERRPRPSPTCARLAPVTHAYSHFTAHAVPWVVVEPPSKYGVRASSGRFLAAGGIGRRPISVLDRKVIEALGGVKP